MLTDAEMGAIMRAHPYVRAHPGYMASPYYAQHRPERLETIGPILSRINEDHPDESIEFDEFEESFRQYLGSSIAKVHTGPISERGSATSARYFV